MFTINIDEDGYYAEGSDGTLVEVAEIPDVEDVELLKAYKYKDGVLEVDAVKYSSIKETLPEEEIIENEEPSIEERIEIIEELLLEMLGGEE